jgi:hypothetical protein
VNTEDGVSEKGALSVYEIPATLYKEHWLRLLGMADDIKAFIEANNERLKASRAKQCRK